MILDGGTTMSYAVRFELKLEAHEKENILKASALAGMTMATFVRTAAQEKTRMMLDQESRIALSQRLPNPWIRPLHPILQKALQATQSMGRA
ncbi:MAG: DUF1778 domain-containing protein [Acidithiobacillus sp.]|nr:DUF1778 domain-containing protein [Acidithiobacillus sp.]